MDNLSIVGTCNLNNNCDAVIIASLSNGMVIGTHYVKAASAEKKGTGFDYSFPVDREFIAGHSQLLINVVLYNDTITPLQTISCHELLQRNHLALNISPVIFHSLGFFGDAKNSKLLIPIDSVIDSVTFLIDDVKSFLNIGGIEIFGGKETKRLQPEQDFTFSFSSSEPAGIAPSRVFEDKGFHSSNEDYPWLKVTFVNPTPINYLKIRNRADRWGSRARNLIVKTHSSGSEKTVYKPISDRNTLESLTDSLRQLGTEISPLPTKEKREIFRASLLKALSDKLYNSPQILTDELQQTLLQVLSTWSPEKLTENTLENEIKILAAILNSQLERGISLNLKPFAFILSKRSNIDLLESNVNFLRRHFNKEEVIFTKHGVAKQGELTNNVSDVMNTLRDVISLLDDLGYHPCIAYGTLLGAYRDNGFISHDDDVDILVRLGSECDDITKEKAIELLHELVIKLPNDKYRVEFERSHNLNIHLFNKTNNTMIDIFPYWCEGDKAFLHMEKMDIRPIAKTILASRKNIPLYECQLPAPADIEGFLLERYGSGWTISDKYHEWPWPLKDD